MSRGLSKLQREILAVLHVAPPGKRPPALLVKEIDDALRDTGGPRPWPIPTYNYQRRLFAKWRVGRDSGWYKVSPAQLAIHAAHNRLKDRRRSVRLGEAAPVSKQRAFVLLRALRSLERRGLVRSWHVKEKSKKPTLTTGWCRLA